uniref:Uncharacterized protein n=1 Tax=candidate division CPR3 bacterium TaxID=2268181 RepID=A0A7C4QXN2_UNCC3
MELRLGFEQKLTQKQELKILQEQKKEYKLQLQLALSGAKTGEKFVVAEICPKCKKGLSAIEVVEGFNYDPLDFETTCKHCGHRFQPKVRATHMESREVREYQLYCPVQTLHALRNYSEMHPLNLEKVHPALYRSANIHFGSIAAAMKENGISYRFKEELNWKEKLGPFLGLVPDVMFARYAGVSPATVSRYRRLLGIRRFSNREIY